MILTDHVIYQTTTQTLGMTFGYLSHVATKGERFFKHKFMLYDFISQRILNHFEQVVFLLYSLNGSNPFS